MTCLVYICSQSCTVEGGIGNEGWNPLGNTHLYVWHSLPRFNVEMWTKWCASRRTRWQFCTSALSLKYTTHVHIYRPSSIAICIDMNVSTCIYGLNAKLLQIKLQGILNLHIDTRAEGQSYTLALIPTCNVVTHWLSGGSAARLSTHRTELKAKCV